MTTKKPNVLLILNDDMGYSDLGCYGGEIDSKNLDELADNGLRFTQFYNTARCCPSRASLLTGLHPHQAGVGHMVSDKGPEEYSGRLNKKCVTIAEVLKDNGYSTYMSGKWHITRKSDIRKEIKVAWPMQRGFDHCYCFLAGAASYFWPAAMIRDNEFIDEEIRNDEDYYLTDAISDNAVNYIKEHKDEKKDDPFFMYVAYTAPHWPLHAKPEDIEKYEGRFDKGWDRLREERMERQFKEGIIDKSWELSDRDPSEEAWKDTKNKDWETRRMEVYAAQIDSMDQGIGRIINALKETGEYENTLILFLADNGGCAEEAKARWKPGKVRGFSAQANTKDGKNVRFGNRPSIVPGPEDTYASYGRAWANLSNTPFRLYKSWTHQGGIATPLIVHHPELIKKKGTITDQMGQLPDIMATIVDITGAKYPDSYNGNEILPMEGDSLLPSLQGKENGKEELFFEHQGNAAYRKGDFKLVRDQPFDWELYDLSADPTELYDLSLKYPEKRKEMIATYEQWANRIGVKTIKELRKIKHKNKPKLIRNFLAWFESKFGRNHWKWRRLVKKRRKY